MSEGASWLFIALVLVLIAIVFGGPNGNGKPGAFA